MLQIFINVGVEQIWSIFLFGAFILYDGSKYFILGIKVPQSFNLDFSPALNSLRVLFRVILGPL